MREKLIELLKLSPNCICDLCGENGRLDEVAEIIADNLIASGVTIQKWVPVVERLPEEDVRVLVWLGTGDITYTQIDTDRLHKKKWRRWTKNVTHWMPLPEPPNGERRTDDERTG